jgi:hypothetical protein
VIDEVAAAQGERCIRVVCVDQVAEPATQGLVLFS